MARHVPRPVLAISHIRTIPSSLASCASSPAAGSCCRRLASRTPPLTCFPTQPPCQRRCSVSLLGHSQVLYSDLCVRLSPLLPNMSQLERRSDRHGVFPDRDVCVGILWRPPPQPSALVVIPAASGRGAQQGPQLPGPGTPPGPSGCTGWSPGRAPSRRSYDRYGLPHSGAFQHRPPYVNEGSVRGLPHGAKMLGQCLPCPCQSLPCPCQSLPCLLAYSPPLSSPAGGLDTNVGWWMCWWRDNELSVFVNTAFGWKGRRSVSRRRRQSGTDVLTAWRVRSKAGVAVHRRARLVQREEDQFEVLPMCAPLDHVAPRGTDLGDRVLAGDEPVGK
jgi:hypothetical protein